MRFLLELILPIGLKGLLSCLFCKRVDINLVGTIAIVTMAVWLDVVSTLIRGMERRCRCCECMSLHVWNNEWLMSLAEVGTKTSQEILPSILL